MEILYLIPSTRGLVGQLAPGAAEEGEEQDLEKGLLAMVASIPPLRHSGILIVNQLIRRMEQFSSN